MLGRCASQELRYRRGSNEGRNDEGRNKCGVLNKKRELSTAYLSCCSVTGIV